MVGRIGGNADLSPRGQKYAERLYRQLGAIGSASGTVTPKLVGIPFVLAQLLFISYKQVNIQKLSRSGRLNFRGQFTQQRTSLVPVLP